MKMRKEKGITLVALVITIIVLIILAAVSIRAVMNDGIIINAQGAKEKTEEGKTEEREKISSLEQRINSAYLPSEYQAVEYIESTGTQYIDTGFVPDNNSRFVLKTNMTKYAGWAFGIQPIEYKNYDFGFAVSRTDDINQSVVTYSGLAYVIEESYHDKVITVDLNKNKIYIDNKLINEFEENTLSSTYPMYLFCGNSVGEAKQFSKIKVYNFKIYNNDVLERDLIPCYRKLDNVAGMYDLVNGDFYENAGEGQFGIGGLI